MPLAPRYMTNRIVAIILPKASFFEWIHATDPSPGNGIITFEDARAERLFYAHRQRRLEALSLWLRVASRFRACGFRLPCRLFLHPCGLQFELRFSH